MNSYIEKIESLPWSLWGGMQINIEQTVLLIIAVAGFGYWLLEKQKAGAIAAVIGVLLFYFPQIFLLLPGLSPKETDRV